MIQIKVYTTASNVMEITREVRASGLTQGKDFDFAYHKSRYSQDSWECLEPEHAVFTFYVDKYATLFTLKYVK